MKDKLISIITVSFNAAETIEQTILSVLNQPYENIEYIIIDGGSTDNTVNIIKKYSDRIAYWVSEPDKGIYDAMNKGISKASGEIIGIINSDDWYAEDVFPLIMSKVNDNPECEIFYGNIHFVDKSGNKSIQYAPKKLEKLYQGMLLYHPAVFVRASVYKKLGIFNCKYRVAADYDLMVRCYFNRIKFQYINNIIADMRTTGLSNQIALTGFKETKQIALGHGFHYYKVIFYYYLRVMVNRCKKVKNILIS